MEYAWDVLARRDIHASDVLDRYRPYLCGHCKGKVYHADGYYQRAHFRHVPGEGKPECDQYFPGDYNAQLQRSNYRPTSRSQNESRRYAALELCINSVDATRWRMFVALPPSGQDFGYVRVQVAREDIRQVEVSAFKSSVRRYGIVPGNHPIGIVGASPGISTEYLDRAGRSETTLNVRGITVFQASAFHRHLPRAARLFWGSSYYFVHAESLQLSVPTSLTKNELQAVDGYRCTFVTIPEKASDDLSDWLAATTGIVPQRRRALLTILHPEFHKIDNESPVGLSHTKEVILSVRRRTLDSEELPELWLETQSGHSVVHVGEKPEIVSIPLQDSDQDFYVRYSDDPGLNLHLHTSPPARYACSAIVTIERDASKTFAVPFFSDAARTLLRAVRNGRAKVVSVVANMDFVIECLTRRSPTEPWIDESAAIAADIRILNSILGDKSREVALDFGPFGYQRFKVKRAVGIHASLGTGPKAALVWLLSQYRAGQLALSKDSDDALLVSVLKNLPLQRSHLTHSRFISNAWEESLGQAASQ